MESFEEKRFSEFEALLIRAEQPELIIKRYRDASMLTLIYKTISKKLMIFYKKNVIYNLSLYQIFPQRNDLSIFLFANINFLIFQSLR